MRIESEGLQPTIMFGTSLPIQTCHPERSASKTCPHEADWRGVEGPREFFGLENHPKAFSRTFPVVVFSIEISLGCFGSRSLALALAQHDRVIRF
jgi:hypothetical protein